MKYSTWKNALFSAGVAVFAGVLLLGVNAAIGASVDPPGSGISPTFTGLTVTGETELEGDTTVGGTITVGEFPSNFQDIDVWGDIRTMSGIGSLTSVLQLLGNTRTLGNHYFIGTVQANGGITASDGTIEINDDVNFTDNATFNGALTTINSGSINANNSVLNVGSVNTQGLDVDHMWSRLDLTSEQAAQEHYGAGGYADPNGAFKIESVSFPNTAMTMDYRSINTFGADLRINYGSGARDVDIGSTSNPVVVDVTGDVLADRIVADSFGVYYNRDSSLIAIGDGGSNSVTVTCPNGDLVVSCGGHLDTNNDTAYSTAVDGRVVGSYVNESNNTCYLRGYNETGGSATLYLRAIALCHNPRALY